MDLSSGETLKAHNKFPNYRSHMSCDMIHMTWLISYVPYHIVHVNVTVFAASDDPK